MSTEPIRILHITDIHIISEPGGRVQGKSFSETVTLELMKDFYIPVSREVRLVGRR